MSSGSRLVAAGDEEDGWVPVAPPDHVDLWVYGELVKDGVVTVSRLHVRGGPGINYRAVGSVKKGDRLTVRGTWGDWLKLAPPPGCRVWVSRELIGGGAKAVEASVTPAAHAAIAAAEPPAAPSVARPEPHPRPSLDTRLPPVAARSRAPVAAPPVVVRPPRPAPVSPTVHVARERIPASSETHGPRVTLRGTLRPVGMSVWRRPSRYRLVRSEGRRPASTLCYVLGDEVLLEEHQGKPVELSGRSFRVQGVRHAVVVVDTLRETGLSPGGGYER